MSDKYDEQLQAFVNDLIEVCKKHKLALFINSYEELAVTELENADVSYYFDCITDERTEVLVQRAAEAERQRIEYELDHKEEIEADRKYIRERQQREEAHARAFFAKLKNRNKT